MIKRFAFLFVVLWIVGGVSFIFLYGRHLQNRPLPELGQIPPFQLMERSGKNFNSIQLQGRPWIADFIFTSCAGPCPMMSGTLARVTQELKDAPDVRFVSFSVDPEHDTPARLSEYAQQYEADPARWFFLTGEKSRIDALALQHFHLALGKAPAEFPDPAHTILHSTKFVLVDSKGAIRGYYDSFEPMQVQKLIRDARRLAEASPHAAA